MDLLRALVPSWRFFDAPAAVPAVEVRGPGDGAWAPLPAPPARRWYAFAWNPGGNVALAEHGLVEHLAYDLGARFDLDAGPIDLATGPAATRAEITALVSFQLVARLVHARAPGAVAWRLLLPAEGADPARATEEILRTEAAA